MSASAQRNVQLFVVWCSQRKLKAALENVFVSVNVSWNPFLCSEKWLYTKEFPIFLKP